MNRLKPRSDDLESKLNALKIAHTAVISSCNRSRILTLFQGKENWERLVREQSQKVQEAEHLIKARSIPQSPNGASDTQVIHPSLIN